MERLKGDDGGGSTALRKEESRFPFKTDPKKKIMADSFTSSCQKRKIPIQFASLDSLLDLFLTSS